MPKHSPISFKEPGISSKIRNRIETFIKKHPTTTSATKAVLALAAVGGVLTISAITPGVMETFSRLYVSHRQAKRKRYERLWQSFYRLKKERALEFKGTKNGKNIYQLTKNGKLKLRSFLLDTLDIPKPNKWDGKWRVVIFDIPEKRRRARKAFQHRLSTLGFYPLQKSVWAHPFPCEEEMEFLKDFFEVRPHADILVVPDMPNGRVIYHFRNLIKEAM
ncbi:MAG: hypothetical protein Q8R12_04125 [bacterium]|nr:hypothetical protein [bacterium]